MTAWATGRIAICPQCLGDIDVSDGMREPFVVCDSCGYESESEDLIGRATQAESCRTFRDRVHAGQELGACLQQYKGHDVLVLGIPRGGVPVAAEVAKVLAGQLDVIVARKLGAPGQPELAIGAVTSNGGRYLDDDIRDAGISAAYLQKVTDAEMAEARRRERVFRGGRPPARMEDRIVIIVDDGLATGATMRASVRSVRSRRPMQVIVAVPVGSREACAELRQEADEVVCPYQPKRFWAVGYHYENFEPTQDDEVIRILAAFRPEPSSLGPAIVTTG